MPLASPCFLVVPPFNTAHANLFAKFLPFFNSWSLLTMVNERESSHLTAIPLEQTHKMGRDKAIIEL